MQQTTTKNNNENKEEEQTKIKKKEYNLRWLYTLAGLLWIPAC